jgi:hypothetical protein
LPEFLLKDKNIYIALNVIFALTMVGIVFDPVFAYAAGIIYLLGIVLVLVNFIVSGNKTPIAYVIITAVVWPCVFALDMNIKK